MKFDYGTIIVILAVLIFYLRLIIIQRQRIKRARYQYAAVSSKNAKKKSTRDKKPEVRYGQLGIQIRSWWLVVGGILLITLGAVANYFDFTIGNYEIWWIVIVLGIALFGMGVR